MTISARDRKIVIFLLIAGVVAAYWFLLLSPKFQDRSKLENQLTQAQTARSTAAQRLAQLTAAKRSFGVDYETVIRLGKSIPAALDMPSLLVQLSAATGGTGIDFTSVQAGTRASAPASGAPQSGTTPAASSGIPGLDSVPLTFEFNGGFFQLADFFHQMKRFVQVVNSQINVNGRLMRIDSFTYKPDPTGQTITADVQATVFLAPKAQGATAGATPTGPAGTASPSTTTTSATTPGTASAAPPAATVTR